MNEIKSYGHLDRRIWMTIPEMATKKNATPEQMGQVLAALGLRWKGPKNRWRNSYPTKRALDEGYVVEVDVSEYHQCWRWNFPKIFA